MEKYEGGKISYETVQKRNEQILNVLKQRGYRGEPLKDPKYDVEISTKPLANE